MKSTIHQTNEHLLQLIQDPERRALRNSVSIKTKLFFDYLRRPETSSTQFDSWANLFTKTATIHLRPDNPLIFFDKDGDLNLAQPYAEQFVLNAGRHFNGALALILMGETCYDLKVGVPARLSEALLRYQSVALGNTLVPAALLHEFLEVDDSIDKWLAGHFKRHRLMPGRHYVWVPDEDTYYEDDSKMQILLRPDVVVKVAVTTPTLRGRKLRACLVKPGMRPFELADNDTALLQLLFTPPARGLASL